MFNYANLSGSRWQRIPTFNDVTMTMRAGLSGLATGITDWGMEISWSHAHYAWPNNLYSVTEG